MTINIERMEADIAAWNAEERACAETRARLLNRHFDVSETGVRDGLWTAEGAIAFARAMMVPGLETAGAAPSAALAALQKVATVTDSAATLAALQFEKSVMRRERSAHDRATESLTVAEGWRENKRQRRRSVNNLTAPCGTSHVYRGVGN